MDNIILKDIFLVRTGNIIRKVHFLARMVITILKGVFSVATASIIYKDHF